MGIIENLSKEKESKALTPEEPEVKGGPSLTEVLDGENSRFFGQMISKDDPASTELATRMARGELNQGDFALLEKYRAKFNKKMEGISKLEDEVTPETLQVFARNSPKFQTIINLMGSEKATAAIKSEIRNLAFGDDDSQSRFANIEKAMNKLTEYKNDKSEFAQLETDVKEKCKEYKVSDKEFEKATKIEDSEKRASEMRKLVKAKYGRLGKLGIFMGIGRKALDQKATDLAEMKDDIDQAIGERIKKLDQKLKSVGEVLATTADDNKELRHAFSREIASEKHPDHEKKSGYREVRKELPSVKAVNDELDVEWGKVRGDDFETLSPTDQDAKRDGFVTKYKEDRKKKFAKMSGFWAAIFGATFTTIIDNKKSNLK